MHILLTTYGILLIFALYCFAQWKSAEDLSYMDLAAQENFVNSRDDLLAIVNDRSQKAYRELRPEEKKGQQNQEAQVEEEEDEEAILTPDSLDEEEEDEEEKPKQSKRTSFLHIAILFNEENANIFEGKGKACFTLLKALITEMYSGQDFFERAKKDVPDLEERFLLNLIEKVKELQDEESFSAARELASLNLDDDLQSYVRYKMFMGNKYRKKKAKHEDPGFYPLTEFISFRKHTHLMSLWLAPRPLLMGLFQNEDVVNDVIAARHEIYNDLKRDKNKSTVQAKENELKLRFGIYIRHIEQFIDFKVSRTQPQE